VRDWGMCGKSKVVRCDAGLFGSCRHGLQRLGEGSEPCNGRLELAMPVRCLCIAAGVEWCDVQGVKGEAEGAAGMALCQSRWCGRRGGPGHSVHAS